MSNKKTGVWNWFECMYQLWLYMRIAIGLSVCISYGCIWALNLVWVYVSVMTVYEHWIGLSVCISYDFIWVLNLVWVYVSVMTVYEYWIWFECMYQLWLYMNIDFGLSVCISYDCIWTLNLVWVYVSVMTVYEHWIWYTGARLQVWPEVRGFHDKSCHVLLNSIIKHIKVVSKLF